MQWYTFYLLIFLWTDSKSRITREIHTEKNTKSVMIMRVKISVVRALGVQCLLTCLPTCGAYSRVVLIRVNTEIIVNPLTLKGFPID